MRFTIDEELGQEDIARLNSANASSGGVLTVREIPDVSFTRCVERTVCHSPMDKSSYTRAWAGTGTLLEFGGTGADALTNLPVLSIDAVQHVVGTREKDVFMDAEVIDVLQTDPSGQIGRGQ